MARDPSKPARSSPPPAGTSGRRTGERPVSTRPGVLPKPEPVVRRKRRRSPLPAFLVLLVAVGVTAGLLVLLLGRGSGSRSPAGVSGRVAPAEPGWGDQPGGGAAPAITAAVGEGSKDVASAEAALAERYVVVDTGRMPWASPTAGPRPRLAYLPPGSQLILLARLADLQASDEGRLFIRSLGPEAETALAQLAAWCGCTPAEIELVQAGWQAGGADEVIGGVAVRLVEGCRVPADDEPRRTAWGATQPVEIEGETYHKGRGISFWVPQGEHERVLVVVVEPASGPAAGPAAGSLGLGEPLIAETIRESIASRDQPADQSAADLPRDLEILAGMLDADRHLTLFGSPHYLLNRGRAALAGPLVKLFKPLEWFFGESIVAAGLSLHCGENCYLELDVVTPFDKPPRKEATELFSRLVSLPSAVEAYAAALNPSPYGRILVLRLPAMLRLLVANARWAPEGEGIVINAYLPGHAPHNLAVAAELTLAQTPVAVGATAAAGTTTQAPAADPLTQLERSITIVFPKDTLEMAVQMVAEMSGVPIEIVGPDLQLEGITKNQSFGLDERDKSARDVLRVILAKANPDGKLVYVVRPKGEQEGEVETILVTTRAAAEKRGDRLPPEFQPPPKFK